MTRGQVEGASQYTVLDLSCSSAAGESEEEVTRVATSTSFGMPTVGNDTNNGS